jgi:hypothetical protein
MSSFLNEEFGFKSSWTEEEKISFLNICFAFAAAWAFGGCLNEKENEKIDNLIKKKCVSVEFPADNIGNCFIDPVSISLQVYQVDKF